MANYELTKEQKKSVEQKIDKMLETMTLAEVNLEVGRFQDELHYLDTHFFIPVDFELKDDKQKNFISHNIFVGFQLHKKIRTSQNANVFKYISNQQIVDIFVNGTLKKEDLQFEETQQEPRGQFIHYSQLSGVANDFKELRNSVIGAVEKQLI